MMVFFFLIPIQSESINWTYLALNRFYINNIGQNYGLLGADISINQALGSNLTGNGITIGLFATSCLQYFGLNTLEYEREGDLDKSDRKDSSKPSKELSSSCKENFLSKSKDCSDIQHDGSGTSISGLITGYPNSTCGIGISKRTSLYCYQIIQNLTEDRKSVV